MRNRSRTTLHVTPRGQSPVWNDQSLRYSEGGGEMIGAEKFNGMDAFEFDVEELLASNDQKLGTTKNRQGHRACSIRQN